MEEPKAAPKLSNPTPTLLQTPLPPNNTRKRPLDSDSNSNYFKIRAVIRDIRPHFIQVLQTPDYKNCKASHEIREQLKIVMKLYDNMKADVVPLEKPKNVQDGQNLVYKTVQEQQCQHVKSSEQSQVDKAFARPSEAEDSKTKGSYVIGGSAFGWNFITFSGTDPVYYGRTKEQFRSEKMTE